MPAQAHFPFAAIVGQGQLKSALLLTAVDPGIGGLLISGPRGSAKSTFARGLNDLLGGRPFVTLPLGATEEMITGSFDLQSALKESEVRFRAGILNRAHGGILYVDEVNLLPDHLVDLLLDAASSGHNIVERDGISHEQDSRFSLIGTMNPDEGELRPQLLDRFGIMAVVESDFSVEERLEIVQRRIEFDGDPDAFISRWARKTEKLKERTNKAMSCLSRVVLGPEMANRISRICIDSGADGLRADITFHRAAKAHAALAGRLEVLDSDIDAVESLVLTHRRKSGKHQSALPQNSDGGNNQGSSGENQGNSDAGGSSIQGAWGAKPLDNPSAIESRIHTLNEVTGSRNVFKNRERGSAIRPGAAASPQYWSRPSRSRDTEHRKIDWRRTLGNTTPANNGVSVTPRRSNSINGLQRPLKFRYPKPGNLALNLVLLDTSASTFSGNGFAYAKGVLQQISSECYLKRRQLCIISFGGNRVTTLLHPQRAPKNLSGLLDTIQPGGGTPAEDAMEYAASFLHRYRNHSLDCHIYLVTDARFATSSFSHPILSEHPATVIDIECSRIRLGLGRNLASVSGARYLHVISDFQPAAGV